MGPTAATQRRRLMARSVPPNAGAVRTRSERQVVFLEHLGKGGFGAVFRAEVRSEDGLVQQVALKILSADMSDKPDVAARQRDEARLLSRLRHHAIVRVFELCEINHRPAILMELVEGVDAAQLRSTGVLSPRSVMQIIAETAGALEAGWSTTDPDTGAPLRVVHRDIKPANLLISRYGSVKVLDFGVARADFEREGKTGSVQFGTARYMAPEQWLERTAGHKVDIYALGVSMVELLTGAPLPRAPLEPRAFELHTTAACEAAAAAVRGQDDLDTMVEVQRLIHQMLRYNPVERPTAAEVRTQTLHLADRVGGQQLAVLAPKTVPTLMAQRQHRLSRLPLPRVAPITQSAPDRVLLDTPTEPVPRGAPLGSFSEPARIVTTDSRREPAAHVSTAPSSRETSALGPHRWRLYAGITGLTALSVAGWFWVQETSIEAETSRSPVQSARPALEAQPTLSDEQASLTVAKPSQRHDRPPAHRPDHTPDAATEAPLAQASLPDLPASQPEPHAAVAGPSEPATATQSRAAPQASFQLVISSRPLGARVVVNENHLGTTPLSEVELPEGDHVFEFVLGEHKTQEIVRIRRSRPIQEVYWNADNEQLSIR